MRVEDIFLEWNHPLYRDYLHFFDRLQPYYTYPPGDDSSFHLRERILKKRESPLSREELARVISQYHAGELEHPAVRSNLDRLTHSDSLVVVGGQQAGILTGPLYTIYKAITLIQLAEREERRLNRPVIPIFWIAGEDHDLEEVNHLHLITQGKLEKWTLPVPDEHRPISSTVPDLDSLLRWIEELGWHLPDTPYKQELLATLMELSQEPASLSRHFARLMHRLFGRYGLLLIDSAFPPLRQLEIPFFTWLIEHNEALGEEWVKQSHRLEQDGYPVSVDVHPDKAHLFLIVEGKREPLYRVGKGLFGTKDGQQTFTRGKLLEHLHQHPEDFSNNVLTRPLMQEYLFPTLATVLGPGELAYWALLKPAFSLAGMEMPILYPRIGLTLVGRKSEKEMNRYRLTVDDVFHRLEEKKRLWLKEQYQLDVDAVFRDVRTRLEEIYRPLIGQISGVRPDLQQMGETNRKLVLQQIEYLERETWKALAKREETDLSRFAQLETELYPKGQLQERVHNVIPWLNRYGEKWLEELVQTPLLSTRAHRVVFL